MTRSLAALALAALLTLPACDRSGDGAGHDHDNDHNGHVHTDGGAEHTGDESGHEHEHDEEVALGTFDIGGVQVEAAQGHGEVEAGKEGHLVIKLPYNDNGQTTVRAWIGTEDRTQSLAGKGEYAASHDDYDIHAVAPDPLPDGAAWWVEIEKPDGERLVGSIPFKKDLPAETPAPAQP